MTLTFPFLEKSLYPYAEQAMAYFAGTLGIAKNRFRAEEAIRPGIDYKPTLCAPTRDFHLLCVEVTQSYFTDALSAFVLDCQREGVPVRLYVAVPPDSGEGKVADLERAAKNRVGILRLCDPPTVLRPALSLSLTGVRAPVASEFPARLRQAVADAYATFVNGNPAQGCLELYQEIEAISRAIGKKAESRGCWSGLPSGANKPRLSSGWEKSPWQEVCGALHRHLDGKKFGKRGLTKPLLSRVWGLCDHRNLTGHKPRSSKEQMKRDATLRTRFEHAMDTLRELSAAVKGLKV